MHFLKTIFLAASLSIALAAPTPSSMLEEKSATTLSDPPSVPAGLKIADNNLSANGDWNSICKSQYGDQICPAICSKLYNLPGKCVGGFFNWDKVCVCS
ncbi:uncharacterized protein RCC_10363 [Ramularia collo-cygni]|uniref:Invertebrate defensins family profile domain-containing protein n=1 Tax=Ramularia collo-cygni TaxID=112498 RepID=A0A2D3VQY5_9PEZI|nr:uncharacterized protein RCC_10363 [Ramularia collo-cygni]CZT24638.1 uncharacterized protein RCC_10363 [Ramularia collo-cygni]